MRGRRRWHLRKDALQVATGIMQEVVAIANRYQPLRTRHGRLRASVPEQPQRDPGRSQILDRPAQRQRCIAGPDARGNAGLRRPDAHGKRPRRDHRTGFVLPAMPIPPRLRQCGATRHRQPGLLDDGRGVGRRSRRDLMPHGWRQPA